jgi:hypothetical protein
MVFFVDNTHGGAAGLCRKLPAKRFTSWMMGQLRTTFIVSRKSARRADLDTWDVQTTKATLE